MIRAGERSYVTEVSWFPRPDPGTDYSASFFDIGCDVVCERWEFVPPSPLEVVAEKYTPARAPFALAPVEVAP